MSPSQETPQDITVSSAVPVDSDDQGNQHWVEYRKSGGYWLLTKDQNGDNLKERRISTGEALKLAGDANVPTVKGMQQKMSAGWLRKVRDALGR